MNDTSAGSAPRQEGVMLEPNGSERQPRWDFGSMGMRQRSPVESGPIEDVEVPPGFGYEQFQPMKREPEDMERTFIAFPRDQGRLQAQPHGYDDKDSDYGSSSSDEEPLLAQTRGEQRFPKKQQQSGINVDLVMLDEEEEGGVPVNITEMGPLPVDHPSQIPYLQTPISQLQNQDYLWQLPAREIQGLEVKELKQQFRNQPLAYFYHRSCATIRKRWNMSPVDCIPERLRAKTPYSLALISRIARLANKTKQNGEYGQHLLECAWNERAQSDQRMSPTAQHHVTFRIDLKLCESALEENVLGLTFADLLTATGWAQQEVKNEKALRKRVIQEVMDEQPTLTKAQSSSLVAKRVSERRRAEKGSRPAHGKFEGVRNRTRKGKLVKQQGRIQQKGHTEPSIAQGVINRRLENRFAGLGVNEHDAVPENVPETFTYAIPFRPAPGTDSNLTAAMPTEPTATQHPAKHPLQIMAEHRAILKQGGDGAEHIKQLMRESKELIKQSKLEQQKVREKEIKKTYDNMSEKRFKKGRRVVEMRGHLRSRDDRYRPSYNSVLPPQTATTATSSKAFLPPPNTMGMFPQDFAQD